MKPNAPDTAGPASLADFTSALAALIGLPPETSQDHLAALKAKIEPNPGQSSRIFSSRRMQQQRRPSRPDQRPTHSTLSAPSVNNSA